MADNPRTTPQTLQASVNIFTDKVQDSIIRKISENNGMFGRLGRRKPLLPKKHGRTVYVCKVHFEKKKKILLEKIILNRREQSGDVLP